MFNLVLEPEAERLAVVDSPAADPRSALLSPLQRESPDLPPWAQTKCTAESLEDGTVGLRVGAHYLSADPDGVIRRDRMWCQAWERFRLVPIDRPEILLPFYSHSFLGLRLMGQLAERLHKLTALAFEQLSRDFAPVRFIQIGAHDGTAGDPLNAFIKRGGWEGLAIEPVPYLFRRLQQTYAAFPAVKCENFCIGAEEGRATFYMMRELDPEPWPWYSHLSSFDKDVILKHRDSIPNLEELIEPQSVEVRRIDTVLREHGLRPNVVAIDTEGHDWEILRTLDLGRYGPEVLLYEWKHLSETAAIDSVAHLRANNYAVAYDTQNILAFRHGLLADGVSA